MADRIYSCLQYFIVGNTTIGTYRSTIPSETMLSRQELIRRGLGAERVDEFVRSLPPVLRLATSTEVSKYKARIELSPEVEAKHTEQLDKLASDYLASYEAVKDTPSKIAEVLLQAIQNWREADVRYHQDGKNISQNAGGLPPWYNQVRTGFEMDRIRAEISVIEAHIKTLLQPVKRAIVKLPMIEATRLQCFEDSMSLSNVPNPDWQAAKHLAEMLSHKLEDHELAEVKEREAEARQAEAEAATKGLQGFKKRALAKLEEKAIEWFIVAVIGGILWWLGSKAWHWLMH